MRIILNGEPRETTAGATVVELLQELGTPGPEVAVEVNLELIPRARHESYVLSENDQVEVVRLVGGG